MSVRNYIFSKTLLKQLVLAASLTVAIIWGALKLLDLYTLHGRGIDVPQLEGLQLEEAQDLLLAHNLRYVINDSIFDTNREKGSIAMQNPEAGTEVKRNRTIYLTTIAVLPEMVPMPDLTDLSRRQAMALLETHGLTVGRIEYKPDIARNVVLEQKYQDGIIEAGAPIAVGTRINLVLGEGVGDNIALVPFVIGMEPEEAARTLISASLNVGEETHFDEDEKKELRVYRQSPDPLNEPVYLQAGSTVDLVYRSADLFDFEAYMEKLLTVPVPNLIGMSPDEVKITLEAMDLVIGDETFKEDIHPDYAIVVRQEPAYDEEERINKGGRVNIWYAPPVEDSESETQNRYTE